MLAFTLVELLVVLAVIAVIASILFPVFAKVRERARAAVCLSNMRQVTLGVLQYSQDYDDRCPLYYAGDHVTPGSRNPGLTGSGGPPDQFWPETVSPYVQTQDSHDFNSASKVFTCPSAAYDAAAITGHRISNVSSYGLTDNWAEWYCPSDCNNGTGQAHSFIEAVAPSNTILLAETLVDGDAYPGLSLALTPIDGGNTGYSYSSCDATKRPVFGAARMFNDLSWRHSERKMNWCDVPPTYARVNVAYADGHAASRTLEQLSDFREWAIFQGDGDVGHAKNVDGQWGRWYP